jgi:hypothetical protein
MSTENVEIDPPYPSPGNVTVIRKIGLLLTLVFDFALFSRNRTASLQSGADAQRGQDYPVKNQPSPYYQDGDQNAFQFHDLLPHYSFPLRKIVSGRKLLLKRFLSRAGPMSVPADGAGYLAALSFQFGEMTKRAFLPFR